MGISRLLSSTDTSAPQLQGTLGSLAAVLKAALVDGYGTTDPLGWTLEYTADTNYRMAFRNNPTTGTGFYFKINDNYSTNSRHAKFSAYEQMTGIDTYVNPLLASEASPYTFHKSYYNTAQGTAVPWFIIGDDRGFWLRTLGDYQRGSNYEYVNCGLTAYIGDYNPFLANSVYNFCFAWGGFTNNWCPGGPTPNDAAYTTFPYMGKATATTSNINVRLMRPLSGVAGAVTGKPCSDWSIISMSYCGDAGRATSYDGIYPLGPRMMLAHNLDLLGTIPGGFGIDINGGTTTAPAIYQQIIVDGDDRWMLCPGRTGTAVGAIALKIGAGWRDDI